jgi:hypothetical protein
LVKQIKLYVEGGGDCKEQHARCREGFRKLLEKSGFTGRMPRIIAGGGRTATFDQFKTSVRGAGMSDYSILLVDSEEVVAGDQSAWAHLKVCNDWERPDGVAEDQAQLMVTCMETWIMADRAALRAYFGRSLHEDRLIPIESLEMRHRQLIHEALAEATRHCKRNYRKGERSFTILAEIDPQMLKRYLPHFLTFIQALETHL